MKSRNRSKLVITILFGYIIMQFLWWEVLLVRQTSQISNEQQKLMEITSTDAVTLEKQINDLQHKKQVRIYMIVGEGTVFLLLLLYAFYRIRKASNKEIELVNQQKNFLLSVTHELKTPIAATKLQLQTLLKHKQLPVDQQEQLLTNAVNETNRLNRLIEDVLLANSADKNLALNKENVNVSELTEQIILNYFSDKKAKGILKTEIQNGLSSTLDKLLFPSIIINLVENAFKYSPDNSQVLISLNNQNGKLNLSVSDNGFGISEKEKSKIFDKFYRVGNEETRNTKGTGLGLYIVEKIVVAHNGTIEVQDNKPNGSVFKVSI
ncbi:MAG: two-component sensor histidine kinase [Sphingobacteriaceae bacterium]|nr:two-component sensor histidine kinase [Sphingobacteriaceae bacterium]